MGVPTSGFVRDRKRPGMAAPEPQESSKSDAADQSPGDAAPAEAEQEPAPKPKRKPRKKVERKPKAAVSEGDEAGKAPESDTPDAAE